MQLHPPKPTDEEDRRVKDRKKKNRDEPVVSFLAAALRIYLFVALCDECSMMKRSAIILDGIL